jgi:hypothetical protein
MPGGGLLQGVIFGVSPAACCPESLKSLHLGFDQAVFRKKIAPSIGTIGCKSMAMAILQHAAFFIKGHFLITFPQRWVLVAPF